MKSIGPKLFLFFVLQCIGCVTLYKTNTVYSPLLKEKGELNLSGSLGIMGCALYNLQSSYAVTHRLGIMLDGMYHYRSLTSGDSSVEKLNMPFVEAGLGYFSRFGKKSNGLFQVYSGGGYGSSSVKVVNSHSFNPELNSKYATLFIQPGIALINKNFEMAFDTRFNYVNIFYIHAYLYNQFEWWNTDVKFYSDTTLRFVLFEPTITLKAGTKNLKGIAQFGLTMPIINSHAYFMANTSSILGIPLLKFTMGLSYTFSRRN